MNKEPSDTFKIGTGMAYQDVLKLFDEISTVVNNYMHERTNENIPGFTWNAKRLVIQRALALYSTQFVEGTFKHADKRLEEVCELEKKLADRDKEE